MTEQEKFRYAIEGLALEIQGLRKDLKANTKALNESVRMDRLAQFAETFVSADLLKEIAEDIEKENAEDTKDEEEE